MSILNTKPRWFPAAIPTISGWANPVTGEILVSVGNLIERIKAETPPEEIKVAVPTVIEQPKEIIMNEQVPEVTQPKQRKPYAPRKPKVIGEVTENKIPQGAQLLGEVVEYDLDKEVIGE